MLRKALILCLAIETFVVLVVLALAGAIETAPMKATEPTPSAMPTFTAMPTFIVPTLRAETPIPTPTRVVITSTPPATVTPLTTLYIAQPGDSFFGISQKLGVDWQILGLLNGTDNPDKKLSIGQQIIIPDSLRIPVPTVQSGKQIIVVIGQQKVYTFENRVLLNTFVVSTGMVYHPTVLGEFKIEVKLTSTTMTDNKTYYLKKVPWTMYFGNEMVSWQDGYSLHGTYWHHNFGHPMSHGCVNMRIEDADWVFHWAPEGTIVTIVN